MRRYLSLVITVNMSESCDYRLTVDSQVGVLYFHFYLTNKETNERTD